MRGARQCAPRKCQCGDKLDIPRSGRMFKHDRYDSWHMHCSCGRSYQWCFHPQSNGCWKIVSDMPLFDSREVVVIA